MYDNDYYGVEILDDDYEYYDPVQPYDSDSAWQQRPQYDYFPDNNYPVDGYPDNYYPDNGYPYYDDPTINIPGFDWWLMP